MNTITVSNLPSITFYTGEDAYECASAVENREYGFHSDFFGDLTKTQDYNSRWSYMTSSTFSENKTEYSNIGDIINSTVSYLNKFKNNEVSISVDKNVVVFNYDYEDDLDSMFENTSAIPSTDLINLLLNVNDMTFNKQNYYRGNIELREISYAHKKYPYRPDGTQYTVNDPNDASMIINYDFSRQFVDYNYIETSYDVAYVGYVMREITTADGTITYVPTEQSYTGFNTYYTYQISNINDFSDRMSVFFDNNTSKVERMHNDLKTYFMSDLDTMLTLSLNTYSLGAKNLYAYFNFSSNFDNWFDNVIAVNANLSQLSSGDAIATVAGNDGACIDVAIGTESLIGGAITISGDTTVSFASEGLTEDEYTKISLINPMEMTSIDLSPIAGKVKSIDLAPKYEKRTSVSSYVTTDWTAQHSPMISSLKVGSLETQSPIEKIIGINTLRNTLEEIDIINCNALRKDFSISRMPCLEKFIASGSSVKTFVPHQGNHFTKVSLPSTVNTIVLHNNEIDDFDYIVTGSLVNLTLDNVSGFDTKEFVSDWVHALETTIVESNGANIDLLHQGIVTNTNLQGISWQEYEVGELLKFKWLGLNNFSGSISVVGSGNDGSLTRHEYLALRETFGDTMVIDKSTPMQLDYTIDEMAFKKKVNFFSIEEDTFEGVTTESLIPDLSKEFYFEINDQTGGHSLLDYFDGVDRIELVRNKENFGYEVTLPTKIYTDNNDSSSLTKRIESGDVLLYKGAKLILVSNRPQNLPNSQNNVVYNYVKVGRFLFSQQNAKKILIEIVNS